MYSTDGLHTMMCAALPMLAVATIETGLLGDLILFLVDTRPHLVLLEGPS